MLDVSALQRRLESADLGRALISAFILVTLLVIFASNLPRRHDSELKRQLSRIGTRYLGATGIDQSWSVFAPEPVSQNRRFEAIVTFRDGSQAVWRPPTFDPFIGALRKGRWSKWLEAMRHEAYIGDVWEPAAAWIARGYADDGRRPVHVTFVAHWQNLMPPGSGITNPWQTQAYFEYEVTPAVLGEEPPE